MVSELRPLVVVMEFLVLVSIHESTLLTKDPRCISLSIEAYDFFISDHLSASVTDCKNFSICPFGEHFLSLFIAH